MKSKIIQVPAGDIDANPFRLLGDYPYNEKKLETIKRSIEDVGLWEGIIGRESGNRVEIAFGHHRHKAALNAGLQFVPVIIRDLTDEQMLQFMGRENLEEYNADFLIMLETWEAATKWMSSKELTSSKVIDVARLLGWTRPRQEGGDMMNEIAKSCNSAHALIQAGHLDRKDLADMTTTSVRGIVERTHARIEQIDKWAKEKQVAPKITERQKSHVSDAAKSVAGQVRGGTIAQKDVRDRVDMEAFSRQIKQDRAIPNFPVYGEALGDMITKMLKSDAANERLLQIRDVVADLTEANDQRIVRRVQFELEQLADRAVEHKQKLDVTKIKNVTPLRAALPSQEK